MVSVGFELETQCRRERFQSDELLGNEIRHVDEAALVEIAFESFIHDVKFKATEAIVIFLTNQHAFVSAYFMMYCQGKNGTTAKARRESVLSGASLELTDDDVEYLIDLFDRKKLLIHS
jgi:hypothetical protein